MEILGGEKKNPKDEETNQKQTENSFAKNS